jgi:Uma2 family endonuclease
VRPSGRRARNGEASYIVAVVSAFPLHRYTFEQYLALEEESSIKHEFLEGEIVAMAGGTPEHAALAMAFGRQLGNQLEGTRCRVFSSDLRVRVVATGLTTYPDVSVVCGPVERDPEGPTTVTNPKIVVEVTSDSSEHYDRGAKLEHFQQIPSLEAVAIVSHRQPLVEVWTRASAGWTHAAAGPGERAPIAPLGVEIDVTALYAAASEPEG